MLALNARDLTDLQWAILEGEREDEDALAALARAGAERRRWEPRLALESAPWAGKARSAAYCSNFAYSVLACFRMGMSGSASFHSAKKSW
jgi:hypothetical protein